MIIPIGAGAGFALGILLIGIREVRDTSLKNLKDARLYTQLPILGSVPLLENDVVVQRRKQVMWVSWATGTLVGLAQNAIKAIPKIHDPRHPSARGCPAIAFDIDESVAGPVGDVVHFFGCAVEKLRAELDGER